MEITKGNAFVRFFRRVKETFWEFVHSSTWTKLSCVVMGLGQAVRGQFVKGMIYLAVEAAFVAFMVLFGGNFIGHLFSGNLGTKLKQEIWNDEIGDFEVRSGDNSFNILLFGVVSLVLLAIFLVLWGMNVKGNLQNDKRIRAGGKVSTLKEDVSLFFNRKFYVPLLIPPMAGLLVFTVMPLIFMILIAFTNYDYQHMPPGKLFDWVGFANFKGLFSLAGGGGFLLVFLRILLWTFIWAFFATFTNYFLGMLVALLINKKGIKLKKLWRTLLVIPIAVPQFVTLLLMQKILDGDGILNVILGTNIRWLADTSNASLIPRVMIILVNIWIGIPYSMLLCSGLLMNIPKDYYEAAKIDGASAMKQFRYITLPYMLQVTGPYLITQFVGNINNFNVIWLLTGGGPVDNVLYGGAYNAQSTDLLVTWLYRLTTDVNPQYNLASVIGIVIFVLCAVMSIVTYNRSAAARREEDLQ